MKNEVNMNQLLRILIQVIARAAVPLATVQQVVGAGKKQIRAFNLCDGTLSQSEISKKTGIDQGNLSRTASRWVQGGVAFWITEDKDARLLHIYPINADSSPPARKRRTRQR